MTVTRRNAILACTAALAATTAAAQTAAEFLCPTAREPGGRYRLLS